MQDYSKKFLSVFMLTILVLLTLLPITASAANVGNETALRNAVESGSETNVVLSGDISLTTQLIIHHNLTLDLAGKNLTITLDATTGKTSNGIKIASGVTLTIKDSAPTTAPNKLTVVNDAAYPDTGFGAAINVTDGTLIIESGTVVANGGDAGAGIGGGCDGAGGNIIISGGTVNATGGGYGAGIGGGANGAGDNIIISGGTVNATGGSYGAGIGGGANAGSGDGDTIEISDGNVTAKGGMGAAGIGGGCNGAGDNIIISGGTVNASGGDSKGDGLNAIGGGAGIGSGGGYISSNYTGNSPASGNITISGTAIVSATGGNSNDNSPAIGHGGAGIGTGGAASSGSKNGTQGSLGTINIAATATITATGGAGSDRTNAGANIGTGGDKNGTGETLTISASNAAELTAALTNVPDGCNIKLLASITYANNIEISGKVVTLDLNGFGLTATPASGNTLQCTNGMIIFSDSAGGGKCVINGDITATASGDNYGVHARNSTVTVNGNVSATSDSGEACGVYAENGAVVTVDGTITATSGGSEVYINLGDAVKVETADITSPTTKGDYFTYTDSTNTVWVRDPATWVAPKLSYGGSEGENVSGGATKVVGYGTFNVEFAIDGIPHPVVTKESGNAKITLVGRNTLQIAAGLPAGTYPVVLKAKNVAGTATFTFTLTVIGGGPAPTTYDKHEAYLDGYPDGTVRPDEHITRAEAAAFFFRALEDKGKNAPITSSLTDVVAGEWYYQAVAYMEKSGVLTGYPDGTFRPNALITRAEFSAIAARFAELPLTAPSAFPDVPDNFWAAKYINGAAAKKCVEGYPDGTFKADNFVTRAEAIVIINRIQTRKAALDDIPAGVNKFSDINSGHWAYADIVEASVTHEFTRRPDGSEIWR